ncbi:MAG: prepilin-type N-terminal cleavage/methylation domain-containing protein [Chthoniobacterales bacterium]
MRNPKFHAAFTLFEVLIAIAIFVLLAGGIFSSVQASFVASSQVVTTQMDSERADAFQQFLRKVFISLPSDAHVELKLRQLGGLGDVIEVRLWPAPEFLKFGTDPGDGVAISAQPDGRGGFRMMLGYFRAKDTQDEREEHLQKTAWLQLLPGIEQVRWRFAPARNPVFEDKWTEQSGRPGLAELTMKMKDGGEDTLQFWIPPLQRRLSAPTESGQPGQPQAPQPGAPQPGGTPPPEAPPAEAEPAE